jgi:NAD(P)-dependent dehydrogenase (short-subunit alcohol dehydrogenase family)
MDPKIAFKSGTAVITGAGSGIGEAMAKKVAAYGMNVVVAELNEDTGNKVCKDINDAGGNAIFVQTDVSKAEAVQNLADTAYDTFGSVELLVNNAGIGIMGSIWEISPENWQKGVGVNILGPIFGMQAFAPRMLKSDKTCYISNVASLAALTITANNAPYISSKHALLSLTESLYVEMQNEENPVKVSVVLPGIVKTGIMKNMTISNDSYGDTLAMMGGVLEDKGMTSEEAADIFLEGIAAGEFWITSHPKVIDASAQVRGTYLQEQTLPKPVGDEIFRE